MLPSTALESPRRVLRGTWLSTRSDGGQDTTTERVRTSSIRVFHQDLLYAGDGRAENAGAGREGDLTLLMATRRKNISPPENNSSVARTAPLARCKRVAQSGYSTKALARSRHLVVAAQEEVQLNQSHFGRGKLSVRPA